MNELKPLQAGYIVGNTPYWNTIVLRTASIRNFEVMDISNPGAGKCWDDQATDLQVKILDKPFMIKIDGKEHPLDF